MVKRRELTIQTNSELDLDALHHSFSLPPTSPLSPGTGSLRKVDMHVKSHRSSVRPEEEEFKAREDDSPPFKRPSFGASISNLLPLPALSSDQPTSLGSARSIHMTMKKKRRNSTSLLLDESEHGIEKTINSRRRSLSDCSSTSLDFENPQQAAHAAQTIRWKELEKVRF